MLKKILYTALLISAASNVYAVDGLGNVKFRMTMKQVEAMGYVCAPMPNKDGATKCQNVDFQNTIYGYAADSYKVYFGRDKKIYGISANLVGIKSMEDYFGLLSKVEVLFPIEEEGESIKGVFVRHVRRDSSKATASVVMTVGTPGIVPTLYSISYFTPAYIMAREQEREHERLKEQSAEQGNQK